MFTLDSKRIDVKSPNSTYNKCKEAKRKGFKPKEMNTLVANKTNRYA